jgi:hypothetical protein
MLIEILKNHNGPTGEEYIPRIVILLGIVNPEIEIATVLRNACRYLAL